MQPRPFPFFLVLALIGAGLFVGCKEEPTPPSASEKKGGGHAAANVEPGSHEDWCDEHSVPESLCSRCNPKLAAAFKATGDWCEEHGLPESQCKACSPDLDIQRPAKK